MKLITLTCYFCKKSFERSNSEHKRRLLESGPNYKIYCSRLCQNNSARTKVIIKCDVCGKEKEQRSRNLKRNKHNFCGRECTNKFLAIAFSNIPQSQQEAKCIDCDITFFVSSANASKQIRCKLCQTSFRVKEKNRQNIKTAPCKACGTIFTSGKKGRYCDACATKEKARGGRVSAAKQVRRSQNEILLANLLIEYYPRLTITTNENFFTSKYGLWDADIIIHEAKLAILWNGAWHYKQIRAKHSFKQVQARDKIKLDVIRDNGYKPYIIKDMGKHDPQFVLEQFEKLKQCIECNSTISK